MRGQIAEWAGPRRRPSRIHQSEEISFSTPSGRSDVLR